MTFITIDFLSACFCYKARHQLFPSQPSPHVLEVLWPYSILVTFMMQDHESSLCNSTRKRRRGEPVAAPEHHIGGLFLTCLDCNLRIGKLDGITMVNSYPKNEAMDGFKWYVLQFPLQKLASLHTMLRFGVFLMNCYEFSQSLFSLYTSSLSLATWAEAFLALIFFTARPTLTPTKPTGLLVEDDLLPT